MKPPILLHQPGRCCIELTALVQRVTDQFNNIVGRDRFPAGHSMCGDHADTQYSTCGRTSDLYRLNMSAEFCCQSFSSRVPASDWLSERPDYTEVPPSSYYKLVHPDLFPPDIPPVYVHSR